MGLATVVRGHGAYGASAGFNSGPKPRYGAGYTGQCSMNWVVRAKSSGYRGSRCIPQACDTTPAGDRAVFTAIVYMLTSGRYQRYTPPPPVRRIQLCPAARLSTSDPALRTLQPPLQRVPHPHLLQQTSNMRHGLNSLLNWTLALTGPHSRKRAATTNSPAARGGIRETFLLLSRDDRRRWQ